MTEQRTCEQCGNSFTPKAVHQRFDFDECRYQHHVEESVSAALQRVEPHPLQEVRDQRTVSKHDRDLGGLIKQAIVDRIKTTGECFPDDLIDLYPPDEVDRCRQLATAQFGSLSAPRGSREPLIRERGRRKSSVRTRKGGKATVWEFTPAGRIHYGLSASPLAGSSADAPGEVTGAGSPAHPPAPPVGTASSQNPTVGHGTKEVKGSGDSSDSSGVVSGDHVDAGQFRDKSDQGAISPPSVADSGSPDSLVQLDGARETPSMYDPFEDAA